uniref:FYVE-type domain-containing protein n=1 Tax=Neobodo designis TaxID=312471 RepID=A0A7S1LW66_NEODS|mmetsp:Transcript_29471/g.91036  ORF Transcript_29471/g.91036 Transcript_29471/m.91036 type:complete len:401 (+) Transcript_29471:36-1238(+)
MPRANTSATVSPHWTRLVPGVARHACYACGRQLLGEDEKRHCHMCYDVFCKACTTAKCVLAEYHYPSDRPQSVCGVCHSLLANFPMLLSRIDDDAGGQLLLPQQRVWVTDAVLKDDDGEAAEHITRDARGRLAIVSPASGVPAAQMAAALNASAKSKQQLQLEHGLELYLVAFRPVNPETTIAIGTAARVPLRCIAKVTRDGATVRLHCTNGTIDLTVGTLVLESEETPNDDGDAARPPASSSSAVALEDSSATSTSGPFARLKAFFGGSPASAKAEGDERSASGSRHGSSGAGGTGKSSSPVKPDADGAAPSTQPTTVPTPPQAAPPVRQSQKSTAPRLVATDMEIDGKAAEMVEAGLKALVHGVRRHFHFRPDVAQMEAMAARAAHAERAKGGTRDYD